MDMHILTIGVSVYQYFSLPSKSQIYNASCIYKLIRWTEFGYAAANVTNLTDAAATAFAIRDALQTLAANTTDNSTVLIYFSGHAIQIVSGLYAGVYLLPVDARCNSDEALAQTAISGEKFCEALKKIPAKRLVVFFDCNHSIDIKHLQNSTSVAIKTGLPTNYYQQLARGRGRIVIASSLDNEVPTVMSGEQSSLFTKHLLDGLCGKAAKVGNVVRILDLFNYIQKKVTTECPSQHPIFKAEFEENFPIAFLSVVTEEPIVISSLDDDFKYDVFISYRRKPIDRKWVKKQFVPALKAAGLRVCLDDTCFRWGRPVIEEMERAVLESRYTLAVFSPDYMESGFTKLENVMAQHLGLETHKVRFIGLIYLDCKPDLRFRCSLMLDMQDEDEFAINVERIVYECLNP